MTSEQIVGLLPGPALDRLVHDQVFGGSGRRKTYSTTHAAYEILGVLPHIVVGRASAGDPGHNPAKPYWAGQVEPVADTQGTPRYTTVLRIFCATPELALCKAALIMVASRQPATV